ncbi:MAG TPA: glycosyltransferase [Terriglobales bacterium]|nr:glycosyltransferase [Terriglobales bacterium]
MSKPVFYDPQRKRWKRLRRIVDVVGLTVTIVVVFFVWTVLRPADMSSLLLPEQKRPYRALKEKERRHPRPRPVSRKLKAKPTQLPLNSEVGIRAAFYVTWSPDSFASLREYVHQIDILYPEWIHVLGADGKLQGIDPNNKLFDVLAPDGAVHTVDTQVMPFLKQENAETEVLPLVNNFDPTTNLWKADIAGFMNSPPARADFRRQIGAFLASDHYRGIILDFESFPRTAQPGFRQLVSELYDDLHARGMKLHVSVPVNDDDFDYKYLAAHSDGLVVMNYDEHFAGGDPGPVASQAWFTKNLNDALKDIPKNKLICAIGGYGYDWAIPRKGAPQATSISAQDAWLDAHDSDTTVDYDSDSLNPHVAFEEDNGVKHEVWFLDAATALNEMRAANRLGINTFALWRLGSEDRSLWAIWDNPSDANAPGKLASVPPGFSVDMEGDGEILKIGSEPSTGTRTMRVDAATGLVTAENFSALPHPYEVDVYGLKPKQVAITFDDGPDPAWTPKMLDVLKAKHATATFFLIGVEGEKYPSLVQRIYDEGNEIGNHTFTHPDISALRPRFMQVELNLTERFFASKIGAKPLLFRPPYSIDQEPDTSDQVRPLEISQAMGYITVGDKIDPNDWKDNPRPSSEQIVASVMDQLENPRPNVGPGNIILLHDGGGDRSRTVKALPVLIDTLRENGYQIVSVAQLLGKTRADVMPPISPNERWSARLDSFSFWLFGLLVLSGIPFVFFVGDALMSARLLLVGAGAIFDRIRGHVREPRRDLYQPDVAVLIPAYNEEKVIVRTIEAVLASDYPKLRVIVVDDGSKDRTLELAQQAYGSDPRVTILTHENGGKASALNYGLEHVTEELFVGIDADTVIAPDAISYLVPHFLDSRIGALAGNAKVGNRVNLWTRWQALEYVTSQNFERRALNVFGAVSVVPGAIGAWRTAAVRDAGGYHHDTVAEDADLTMALLKAGYRVEYEDRALAFTEAPVNANGLMRQRFRWSFGIMQAVWKHRDAFARKGALGWIALPNIFIFQIVLPILSPLIDIMFVVGVLWYLGDKYFHPETANPATLEKLVGFFFAFLVIDFIASAIAFALERRDARVNSDYWLLAHVWLQRFAYRQLFSVVLLKTLKRAIDGRPFAWDKLERTAQELGFAKARTT